MLEAFAKDLREEEEEEQIQTQIQEANTKTFKKVFVVKNDYAENQYHQLRKRYMTSSKS